MSKLSEMITQYKGLPREIFVKEALNKNNTDIKDEERFLERKEDGSVFKILLKRPILIFYAIIMFFFNFGYAQFGFGLPIQFSNLYLNKGAELYVMDL